MKWITSKLNDLLAGTNVQNVGIAQVFIPIKEVDMKSDARIETTKDSPG